MVRGQPVVKTHKLLSSPVIEFRITEAWKDKLYSVKVIKMITVIIYIFGIIRVLQLLKE